MMKLLSTVAAVATAANVKEYVAMVPAAAQGGHPTVEWLEVEYNPESKDAKNANWSFVNGSDAASESSLGAWRHLDLSVGGGSGAMLSAKVVEGRMYVLIEKVATL